MEYLDILNENGEKTGIVKERKAVHSNGDLHGTVHIWIARKKPSGKGFQILLQKRCKTKDSHPGCFDTSSAGHIEAGGEPCESALRELKEELGIEASEKELLYLFSQRTHNEGVFYGKKFIDNQISHVYLFKREVKISSLKLQRSEIETVMWMDYEAVYKKLKASDKGYCINIEEFEKLGNILYEK